MFYLTKGILRLKVHVNQNTGCPNLGFFLIAKILKCKEKIKKLQQSCEQSRDCENFKM